MLDTHALVWWVNDDGQLSRPARRAIERERRRENGQILVSSISAWEIALLAAKGRLVLTLDVGDWLDTAAEIEGVYFVPVDNVIAVHSVQLPGEFHPDPADRIITALARHHSAPVVTGDSKIRAYRYVETIW